MGIIHPSTAGLAEACLPAFALRMRGSLEKRFASAPGPPCDWISLDKSDQVCLHVCVLHLHGY